MIKFYSRNNDMWSDLSNMCGAGFFIKDDGIMIWMNCVEKFYVYCKSIRKKDRNMILRCKNGYECKKMGKKIELRDDWDDIKIDVMRHGLRKKFEDKEMKRLLLSSRNSELIEENPWDSFWGCGKDGKGLNMMGKLLMELRSELR